MLLKSFWNGRSHDKQKSYRGFSSNVAHEPLQEIQIDLRRFTDSAPDNNGFKFAVLAIDACTEICHIVPIKDKQPEESVRAMKEILDVKGRPNVVYHDNEGS